VPFDYKTESLDKMVKPKPQPCTLALPLVAFDDEHSNNKDDATTTPIISTLADFERELPGICQRLFETLGSQQSEATYQRCLSIDLLDAGVQKVHLEVEIPLTYKGVIVSCRRADMIVELACGGRALLEFKAINKMTIDHRKQIEYYLYHANIDEGYLVNFPHDTGFPDVTGKSRFEYNGLAGLTEQLVLGGSVLRLRNNPKNREVQVVHIRRKDMDAEERKAADKASHIRVVDFMTPVGRTKGKKSGSDDIKKGTTPPSDAATPPPTFGMTKKGKSCKLCIKVNRLCHIHVSARMSSSVADEVSSTTSISIEDLTTPVLLTSTKSKNMTAA